MVEGRLSNWRTVSVRQELIEEAEKLVKSGRYKNVSEFIAEAITLRLEKVKGTAPGSSARPELLLYTPKHTWAQITPEGNIRVGITEYAQRHLKGIARVLTEPAGKEIRKMDPFGVAETWMFMFDLYAPVSGKVVKVNERLNDEPDLLNEDPYGRGWVVEIEPKDPSTLEAELRELLSAGEYDALVRQLEGRLQ